MVDAVTTCSRWWRSGVPFGTPGNMGHALWSSRRVRELTQKKFVEHSLFVGDVVVRDFAVYDMEAREYLWEPCIRSVC